MDPATSLEHFDLWIHARVEVDRRAAGSFQIRIEEAAHCVRGNGKLPAAVDPDQPDGAERSHHEVALQQRAIIAEQEVIRAADRNAQPPTGGLVVVDRLDVAADAARLWIRAMDVRAQEKHKRLLEAVVDDAAKRHTVDVDARGAPRVVMAELCRLRAAERVSDDADARHVETAAEPA